MTDAIPDYVRMPIPDAALVDTDGSPVPLTGLARDHAVLLVFPGPPDHRRRTLGVIGLWARRLPLVDFVLVAPGPDADRWSARSGADRLLADPDGGVRALFGQPDRAAAVLLGTDGLLAGGPVFGPTAITRQVEDIAEEFREAYGEALRPPTAISAKCITYGRVDQLEEALESFLRQDYDADHELVIVNDYPRQRLHFDHPRVRIFNLDFTFDTIGAKENFAVSACRHDTIAVWDDDDIALPNHLRNVDRYYPGHDLLHWGRGAFFKKGRIAALTGLGNSGMVYSRHLWGTVGGHALENAGYDVTFVQRLRAHGARVAVAEPPPAEVSWFYSWRNGSYHMSGMGSDDATRPSVVQRHAAHIEELRRAGRIPTGDIELKPNWSRDYASLLAEHCAQHAE